MKRLDLLLSRTIRIPGTGCLEWTGCMNNDGYGRIRIGRKSTSAHRVIWILTFGDIARDIFVCHHCDNRRCINVQHLFLGTNRDNMLDCKRKGRMYIPPSKELIHGTTNAYGQKRCRCDICRKGERTRKEERRVLRLNK